jgi:tetratricopeptide (TPR) repeat protein
MRHKPQRRVAARSDHSTGRRLKNTDSAVLVYQLRAAVYAMAGGIMVAALMAWKMGPVGFLIGFILGWSLAYVFIIALMHGAGAAAGVFYAPSGKSAPARREYSEAQALRVGGHYAEAVATYETFVAEFPEDPEPYLQIARILRDDLHQYGDAARWFRRARREARLTPGQELLVAQELIELYRHQLNEPGRALPELARIPQLVPGTPQAEAARRELAELHASMRVEQEDGGRSGP